MMYTKHIADNIILKAERLDVEESQYIPFQTGQPTKVELLELLKSRLPERNYEIIEQINGRTIKRV